MGQPRQLKIEGGWQGGRQGGRQGGGDGDTFADSHALQRVVEESEFIFGERVGDVAQLVGVDAHVVVGDETGDEFAVERIVRWIQRPDAPVRVVVGVHAHAERTWNKHNQSTN